MLDLLICEERCVADCDDTVHRRGEETDQPHQGYAESEDGGIGGGVAAYLAELAILTCVNECIRVATCALHASHCRRLHVRCMCFLPLKLVLLAGTEMCPPITFRKMKGEANYI